MPILGESKKDPYRNKQIWLACIDCGKERWVVCRNGKPLYQRCIVCANSNKNRNQTKERNPSWKDGKTLTKKGYVLIRLDKNDSFYAMVDSHGYIPEHRLVMARELNRCLTRNEKVHHINGIKNDNNIINLELISPTNHTLYKQMCANCPLRKENRKLRQKIREMESQLSLG